MKLIRCLIPVTLLVFIPGFRTLGQKQNIIKLNLANTVLKTPEINFEFPVDDKSSVAFSFYYTWFNPEDTELKGWALTPEYRFYLGNSYVTNGLYVAPYFRFQNYNVVSEISDKGHLRSMGIGAIGGYQTFLARWLTLEGFLGVGFNYGGVSSQGLITKFHVDYYEGLVIRFGLSLGIAL